MKSLYITVGLTTRLIRSSNVGIFNQLVLKSLSSTKSTGINFSRSLHQNSTIPSIYKQIQSNKLFSTKTAPPPPPPPPPTPTDKNAKGKRILNRITRAFTFSFATVLVVVGTGIALLVVYLILSELFLPTGDTRTFNKAVNLVEKNPQAQLAMQFEPGSRIKAHGDSHGGGNWVRNRPVHGLRSKGKDGKDHLLMKFHVKSDAGIHGTVVLEQVDNSYWSSEFSYIALDIPGHKRIWIIEPKWKSKDYVPKLNGNSGFLGLKWGPKKDE